MSNSRKAGCCCDATSLADVEVNKPSQHAVTATASGEVNLDGQRVETHARPAGIEGAQEQSAGHGRDRRSGRCCC